MKKKLKQQGVCWKNEEKIEAARRMLERGKMTKEEIAEDLDLPLSVVERLENDLQLA